MVGNWGNFVGGSGLVIVVAMIHYFYRTVLILLFFIAHKKRASTACEDDGPFGKNGRLEEAKKSSAAFCFFEKLTFRIIKSYRFFFSPKLANTVNKAEL